MADAGQLSLPPCPPWAKTPTRRVIIAFKEHGEHKEHVLREKWTIVGRGGHLILTHKTVSRVHAGFAFREDGRLYFIDLGSTHGTKVDGARLEKHKPLEVKRGARIECGEVVLKISFEKTDAKRPRDAEEVTCSHLLVKHKDSRRPSSWKEEVITRSKEDAVKMLDSFENRLRQEDGTVSKEEFAKLASRESHCSSAHNGGDLGRFGRGKMQPSFEEAAFSLKVGEMSSIVESQSGVHLILRTQ